MSMGTLDKLTKYTMKLAKGKPGLLPIVIFSLTMILTAVGPGNIAMIALIAPIAMAIAGEAKISALMMSIMVVNGANAGAFSPIAPTGLISEALVAKIGLPNISWVNFFNNIIGNFFVSLLAYFLFGGIKLWKSSDERSDWESIDIERFDRKQWMTLAVIGILIVAVIGFKLNVGLTAFVLAILISILGLADESKAVKAMPWNAIMMVSGVSIPHGNRKLHRRPIYLHIHAGLFCNPVYSYRTTWFCYRCYFRLFQFVRCCHARIYSACSRSDREDGGWQCSCHGFIHQSRSSPG
jgi:Na+/H+ antiporter NhaD/arsenite permease-like protein